MKSILCAKEENLCDNECIRKKEANITKNIKSPKKFEALYIFCDFLFKRLLFINIHIVILMALNAEYKSAL